MSANNKSIKVGISIGDINGIGIEIIIKTLMKKELLGFFTPVVFASSKLINYQTKLLKLAPLNYQGINSSKQIIDHKVNIVNLWRDNIPVEFGKPTKESGNYALESLEAATKALKEGDVDILVTAPIDKNNIQSERFQYPGHTEYLENYFKQDSLMLMCSEEIRVALVTQHIPIEKVASTISEELIISKAKNLNNSLKKDFYMRKPKIAILGLNPHNGDNGLIGKEEQEIITPAIEKLKKQNILAFGPYPADSFFMPSNLKKFDAILAMYHDQGLTPFKSLTFDEGVNFTAGLDGIRTSPDHGVAFDIAGKGIANEESFKEAIFMGIKIFKNRGYFAEDNKNPLRSKKKFNSKDVDEDLPEGEEAQTH